MIAATSRFKDLDILRGIAIFLVVFGHITHTAEIRNYIWSFHIPIFFFISGLLFTPSKYENFKFFLKYKIKSLVIPYIIFYLITLIYYICIESHVRGGVSLTKLIIGLFYGSYYDNYMYFNGALWFLPCLFSMEIIGYSLKFIHRKWCIILFSLSIFTTGIILIQHNITWLPWGINAALCGFIFYSLGFSFQNSFINKIRITKVAFLIVVVCSMLQFIFYPFPYTDLATCTIKDPILYIIISCIGILLYLSISCIIKQNFILEYLGLNSLIIFVFQEPIYRIVIFIFAKLLHISVESLRTNITLCIIIAIVSILVIIPIIYIYNRWIACQLKQIKI